MTGRRPATRRSSPDTFAAIQAQMERAEARRRRVLRLTVGLAALALVATVVATAVALASGEPAEPELAIARAPGTIVTADEIKPAVASEPDSEQVSEPSEEPKLERAPGVEPEPVRPPAPKPSVQRLELAIGAAGYEPSVLSAKAGVPIRLTVGRGEGCAAGLLIPGLGVQVDNSAGDATVDLGALEPGDYRFTCGMEMVEGVLEVR